MDETGVFENVYLGHHGGGIACRGGEDESRALLGEFGEGIDVLVGNSEGDGVVSTLSLRDGLGNATDTLSICLGTEENRLGFAGCLVDLLSLIGL